MFDLRRFERVPAGAALVLVLCGFGINHPCHAQRHFQAGVGTHIGAYPLAPTQAALAALDATVRDDVRWSSLEVTPGRLEWPSTLKDLELLVADAVMRGKRPLIVLPNGNQFYDGGGQITSPQGIAAYARYARFVASHFKGRVDQFEVWNEWDQGGGSARGRRDKGDAAAYVNLLHASYAALKAESPGAVVIGGAMSGANTAWIEQFAKAGGLQYLDGVSIHPYVHCNAPPGPAAPANLNLASFISHAQPHSDTVRLAFAEGALKPIGGTPEQAIALVDRLKDVVDRYSSTRAIPLYVTEMGWPTSIGQCGIQDAVAAAYLQRFMLLAAARPYVGGVWWYDLFDDGDDPTNREQTFGLHKHDRTPKATYRALLALKSVLNSDQVPVEMVGANGEITVSGRTADGKPFYAAWLPTNSFITTQPWAQGAQLARSGYRVVAPASASATAISAIPTLLVHE